MVILIFMKWSINWQERMGSATCYDPSGDGCQPPNLITSLINIALAPGDVDEPIYKGQAEVQNVLLFLAFASVPILLFAKPYMISRQHNARAHPPTEE